MQVCPGLGGAGANWLRKTALSGLQAGAARDPAQRDVQEGCSGSWLSTAVSLMDSVLKNNILVFLQGFFLH